MNKTPEGQQVSNHRVMCSSHGSENGQAVGSDRVILFHEQSMRNSETRDPWAADMGGVLFAFTTTASVTILQHAEQISENRRHRIVRHPVQRENRLYTCKSLAGAAMKRSAPPSFFSISLTRLYVSHKTQSTATPAMANQPEAVIIDMDTPVPAHSAPTMRSWDYLSLLWQIPLICMFTQSIIMIVKLSEVTMWQLARPCFRCLFDVAGHGIHYTRFTGAKNCGRLF